MRWSGFPVIHVVSQSSAHWLSAMVQFSEIHTVSQPQFISIWDFTDCMVQLHNLLHLVSINIFMIFAFILDFAMNHLVLYIFHLFI